MTIDFDLLRAPTSRDGHSAEYLAAITSAHWRTLKAELVAANDGSCERCGAFYDKHSALDLGTFEFEPVKLELHHRHYRTLGRETPDDVELLCEECHEEADVEREAQTAARVWSARVRGWGRASGIYDYDEAEASLESYLDREGLE